MAAIKSIDFNYNFNLVNMAPVLIAPRRLARALE